MTGEFIIKPQFVEARGFSSNNGLAAVKINNKWGFIDKTGNFVVEPRYEKVGGFSEGLAYVGFSEENQH